MVDLEEEASRARAAVVEAGMDKAANHVPGGSVVEWSRDRFFGSRLSCFQWTMMLGTLNFLYAKHAPVQRGRGPCQPSEMWAARRLYLEIGRPGWADA